MDRLGRYELGDLLGRGGQGDVHSAILRGPGGMRKPVALKVLRGRGGLQREARIGGLLRHPNLVDVYEVGELDGTWFIAMERCDGTLADRLPLPPRAVVQVGLQVCDALQYAHEELGLVHLDLKPSNLLTLRSTVKVADLGIAEARGFEGGRGARGTLGYMAPELMRGGPVDARTDVYALGVVLQELATGERAGAAETFSVEGEASASEAPAWLQPIVDRCRASDPADRYPSMASLADALRSLRVPGASLTEFLGPVEAPTPEPRSDRTPHFVGRGSELGLVESALPTEGLLTLTGPGGIGKTRLAREVAARSRGPSFLVELAPARTRTGMLFLVATALGIPLTAGSTPELADRVGHALRALGDVLLVLDNFEHLAAHASLLVHWRRLAPDARLLVTSRSVLHVDGERSVALGSMSESDSVALLTVRARDRGLDVHGDPALPELARRLGGLPLALELAAGRMGVLSPAEVLERLGLSLLRTGEAGVPQRQATMTAAIQWSWDLLPPHEQECLAQLSVFHAPFTAEAAEAVVALPEGAPWVVDVLGTLVERSMLVARDGRLAMLEPIREFCAAALVEPAAAEARHGAWFARFGAPTALWSLDGLDGFDRNRERLAELEDILIAARRAIDRSAGEVAARCVLIAARLLEARGPIPLALDLIEAALPVAPDHRAELLARRSSICAHLRRPAGLADGLEARAWFLAAGRIVEAATTTLSLSAHLATLERNEEAVDILHTGLAEARGAGDPLLEASLLAVLGLRLDTADDSLAGLQVLEASLALCDAHGHWRTRGAVLGNLAKVQYRLGRLSDARRSLEAAVEHSRTMGSGEGEAVFLANLARVSTSQMELDRAVQEGEAARAAAARQGSQAEVAMATMSLATTAHSAGQLARSVELWSEAIDLWRALGAEREWVTAVVWQTFSLVLLGRFDEALRSLEEAARTATAAQPATGLWVQVGLASVDLGRGRCTAAATRVQGALGDGVLDNESFAIAHHVLADAALQDARYEDVLRHIALAEQNPRLDLTRAHLARVEAHIQLGRVDEGTAELDALSRRLLSVPHQIELLLVRARALHDRAAAQQALQLVDRLGWPESAPIRRDLAKL